MAADWSLLPSNLVDSVAVLLNAADQARMAAVCKPWRQAMADGFCSEQRKPSIWMTLSFFTRRRDVDSICELQGFSEDVKRKYVFPMPDNVRVRGSSRGWLMLEDAATRVHAYNPLTKKTLSFPAAGRPREHKYGTVIKAVIVRREGLPPMVAILRRGTGVLQCIVEIATAAIGDDSWTVLPFISATDIAVCQATLYAVDVLGKLFVYDLRTKDVSSSATEVLPEQIYCPDNRSRIGSICGKLVIVRFWTIRPQSRGDWSMFSPQCEVLTLDTSGPVHKWVPMKDLAGHAILVGYDGMMALRAGEYENLEANCVYFLSRENHWPITYTVEMNVKTEAFSFDLITNARSRQPFWFLPNSDQLNDV